MNLEPFIKEFFKTPEAKETCRVLREYGVQCDSFIEFGSRGGITAIALLQSLIDKKRTWAPRYVGVDFIKDESIVKIAEIAEKIGVSFQFWKGNTKDFPVFETDGFLWDTFHCAGNLFNDLERVAPYTHKYIIIVGTKVDGLQSEAIRRKLDIETVSKELRIVPSDAEKGLLSAISKFLDQSPDWAEACVIGDITILKRIRNPPNWLFKSS